MLALLALLPQETRADMVNMYRRELSEQIELLEAGLDCDPLRAAELARFVHKLAGAAGMMQDKPLADAACALQASLRRGVPCEALRAAAARLRHCAARTLAVLEQACA